MKNNYLVVIGGAKGGVGKTMVALAIIDLLSEMGGKVLAVDCDKANPDVHMAYKDSQVQSITQKLEDEDSAIRFSNIIEQHQDSCIVLNTAAGDRMNNCVGILSDVCLETKRVLITLWVIGTDRDSLEQLVDYQKVCEGSQIFVVVNGLFGDESNFDLYHGSNLKKSVETIIFPKLSQIVASKIRKMWLSYSGAMEAEDDKGYKFLTTAERSALFRFRENVKECFSGLLSHLGLRE